MDIKRDQYKQLRPRFEPELQQAQCEAIERLPDDLLSLVLPEFSLFVGR